MCEDVITSSHNLAQHVAQPRTSHNVAHPSSHNLAQGLRMHPNGCYAGVTPREKENDMDTDADILAAIAGTAFVAQIATDADIEAAGDLAAGTGSMVVLHFA